MAEKKSTSDYFKINNADLKLGGVDLEKKKSTRPKLSQFVGRRCEPNKKRVSTLCLAPLIPAALLIWSAFNYYKSVPPGDLTTRWIAVSLCAVFAGMLLGGAVYFWAVYGQKRIDLEPQRVVVVEGEGMITASWSEVVTEPVRVGAFGVVKTFVFHVAGRRKSIDSVFYRDFDVIVSAMNERASAANYAMKDQTHIL